MISLEVLDNYKCKTCDNLSYWDGYMCVLEKHNNSDGKLSDSPIKTCKDYKKIQGKNWDFCKGQECVFLCIECNAFKKNSKK